MVALHTSLMNELTPLAEGLLADLEQVRRGFSSDPSIGRQFRYAGRGHGGGIVLSQ